MHGVIGPSGRGVISASTDAVAAEETRAWLIAERVPAAVPAEIGLRAMLRWAAVDPFENPRTGQARFWASATRRAAVVAEGDDAVIALPRGAVSEVERTEASAALREVMDTPPPARIAVFGGAWVAESQPEYQEAWMLGRRCAQAGIEIVNGGYGGVMAAVSCGAAEARGTVVGVTIGSFSEHVPVNRWVTHEVEADDLFARLPLICDAEAWVAFPGGVGTLSEVALCWNLIQTESVAPRPLVVVGERWDRALKTFRELLVAEDVHFDMVRPAISADDAFEQLDEIGLPAG